MFNPDILYIIFVLNGKNVMTDYNGKQYKEKD